MKPNLTVLVQNPTENYQVVTFTGEFDKAGHAETKDIIEKTVQDFALKDLVFDFSGLKFINSEGIGYLIEIHTHLVQRGKRLIIVGADDHIKDVFETIGIISILPLFKDVNEYVNSGK